MTEENNSDKKSAAESFGDMLKEFGGAVAEIFNDPELKNKAREFGESAKESAKTFAARFKDDEVRGKFKDVGKAAQNFGESVSDFFRSEKNSEDPGANTDNLKDESRYTSAPVNEESKEKLSQEDTRDINEGQTGNDASAGKTQDKVQDDSYIGEQKNDHIKPLKEFDGKFDGYFSTLKAGRITGYVFAIIFGIAWLIFVNYFNGYIAFYNHSVVNGVSTLTIIPVITEDIKYWLPFFTISMAIGILGNIILVIYERFYLVKIINIIKNLFFVAATATLIQLFPFDFSKIPFTGLSASASSITTAVLIIIIVGISAGIISDFIKLIIFFSRSGTTRE